jgi:hypothetical protein
MKSPGFGRGSNRREDDGLPRHNVSEAQDTAVEEKKLLGQSLGENFSREPVS